jgi:hypothetical protein
MEQGRDPFYLKKSGSLPPFLEVPRRVEAVGASAAHGANAPSHDTQMVGQPLTLGTLV